MNETLIRSGADENYLLRLFYSFAKPSVRPWRGHHHTELEISLVRQGSGVFTVGKKVYDIAPGDVFLFGTHEEHYITGISEGDDMKLMNIHFEPRFIWASSGEMFDAKYFKIFFDRSPNFENRLDRSNPATAEIRRLLDEIEEEATARSSEYELMIKVKLLTILVLLIRDYDYVSARENYTETSKYAQISRAMKFLDDNISEEFTLEDLAGQANLNRTYFITLFKKLNGVTPWEYITARRVELAKTYLREGRMSVLQVATACGFNNASNFNRAFKKVTGQPPSAYRASKSKSQR